MLYFQKHFWQETVIRLADSWVFVLFCILQCLCFYAVDKNIIDSFFYTIHVDKIVITYSVFFLVCFNGRRNTQLLLSTLITTLVLFIPISTYNNILIAEHINGHDNIIYYILLFLYPLTFSINYYIHHFGFQLNNNSNHAYLAFWRPVTQTMICLFHLVMVAIAVSVLIIMCHIIGLDINWNDILHVQLIKWYMPIIWTTVLWTLHSDIDTTDNIIRQCAYLAQHLYWILAPVGLLLLLGKIIATVIEGKVPGIDFNYLLAVCAGFVFLYQLASHPEEIEDKPSALIAKTVKIFNTLLPFVPLAFLWQVCFDFTTITGDIECEASLITTGINWGNFAPCIAALTLSYLTLLQAYFSYQEAYITQQKLPVYSWYWCFIYIVLCLMGLNPILNLNPSFNHYQDHCHHFQTVQQSTHHSQPIRYLA